MGNVIYQPVIEKNEPLVVMHSKDSDGFWYDHRIGCYNNHLPKIYYSNYEDAWQEAINLYEDEIRNLKIKLRYMQIKLEGMKIENHQGKS